MLNDIPGITTSHDGLRLLWSIWHTDNWPVATVVQHEVLADQLSISLKVGPLLHTDIDSRKNVHPVGGKAMACI